MNCCKECDCKTSNPKFCGRSCAVTYNNRKYPKRQPEGNCKACQKPNSSDRTYCKPCWESIGYIDWTKVTLAEIKEGGNANYRGRYPYLRTMTRKDYLRSDRPKECWVCGYDKHFEVCHIKDIKDFLDTAFVSEISDPSNTVALCRNHHWEFDNGLLEL